MCLVVMVGLLLLRLLQPQFGRLGTVYFIVSTVVCFALADTRRASYDAADAAKPSFLYDKKTSRGCLVRVHKMYSYRVSQAGMEKFNALFEKEEEFEAKFQNDEDPDTIPKYMLRVLDGVEEDIMYADHYTEWDEDQLFEMISELRECVFAVYKPLPGDVQQPPKKRPYKWQQ